MDQPQLPTNNSKHTTSHVNELYEVKDFLESVIANAPVGIMTIDMNKSITVCNHRLLAILKDGVRSDVALYQPTHIFLKHLPFLVKAIDRSYERERKSFNIPIMQFEDKVLTVKARKITDGMLLYIDDITDLAKTQSALEQQKKIDKMKTEFLSLAAHQLRTPLTEIRWGMELILKGELGEISEEIRKTVFQLHQSDLRMVSLINNLLNVSRIEQGLVKDTPQKTDIIGILKNVITDMQPIISGKSITVKYELAPDMPETLVDPQRFYEIIQNIVTNAVKYNKENGAIIIASKKADNHILLTFADTGIGIPLENQDKIFTKFYRADNASSLNSEGSGLGLYLVKTFIERWGGSIWFESPTFYEKNIVGVPEKKGTTIYLQLPIPTSFVVDKKN